MNIYVLLKQTFDTEEKVVLADGGIAEDGAKFIINPYDEYAVEEAIRQKEQHGGSVTVVSVGPERCAEALRTALAMGADEAVLISGDGVGSDGFGYSTVLAAYLQRQSSMDLILGGLFSVDQGAGQTAIRVACLLNLPHVSSITKLDIDCAAGTAVAIRDAEGDSETLEVTLPAVFTAQQGLNEPRYPSLPGIMKAKKKPFHRLTLADLGLSEAELSAKTARVCISLPSARQAGQRLPGDPQAQAAELVRLLRTQANVL
ncbi:electron transfer flavoprotein subunit beta/FixA family protein [Paenibacillus allorhizosphaerae]|uniref:Electron transfer flavoprotein subunit beta n=1 Tax=Paenibacillus allorhizosphaerae TaxID=2849866 RepID=A0ABN7TW02_9BACL|nr:electron transfer flavoprotein subunit beta/FixA family protein [Paenibacillus allorhizosphaerae]CAG7657865.1 Electron transfer flavoprotein subunit beta [Paenibacillus allorhizosphaerae]